jgi:hypothetical protein
MLLNGEPISDADARTLVDLLLRHGGVDEKSAAGAINAALGTEADAVDLSPAAAAAVIRTLNDEFDVVLEDRSR